MSEIDEVRELRDEALIERLSSSVRKERRVTVTLLVEMGEVLARGVYRELGFSSMFGFATRRLGMSEAEAALRIRAARVGRSFPEALALLGRCEVNLTTLSLLAPILTQETLHLLHEARFKSKEQVLQLIARHAPRPDTPDSVRRLPQARPSARTPQLLSRVPTSAGSTPAGGTAVTCDRPPASEAARPLHTPSQLSAAAGTVEPLSAERHRISFTGSQWLRDLLHEAQDLRRHRYPAGDLEPLFGRALVLLVAEEKTRRFGLTPRPRARTKVSTHHGSRYIPNAVRREAWARHGGRCCFTSADGHRCHTRSLLEFHHVAPFGRGGAATADNIELVCRAHNALHADRDYGRAFMQARIEQRTRIQSKPERPHRTDSLSNPRTTFPDQDQT